ncbi:MAG: protein-glutamate O-methyltransferase CheR [Proteobacteria bacterium]|nr:protein-glutamate O-methyltransferase CheR [Pseudomonadota bacterium]MBU1715812.1 protein-glutamate O-methyltransferase CheR [Pseudomonadota bacterium]
MNREQYSDTVTWRLAQLTEPQFEKFSALVFEKTGIYLKSEKMELLNARLGKRLRACKIDSFKQYYDYVINDRTGQELVHLIDSVSTNFTSFFREKGHFDFLTSSVLPSFVLEKRGVDRDISVWSAACSSGEEPYTLAMVIDDYLSKQARVNFKIRATDISTKVLGMAERAVYPEERVSMVSSDFLRRYFQKGSGGSAGYVKVKDQLKNYVKFERFNLMDEFKWNEAFDIIFCRNVMIYFNRETQAELVRKFYQCLSPGGYLFIGHSESISSIKNKFEQVAATAYRK